MAGSNWNFLHHIAMLCSHAAYGYSCDTFRGLCMLGIPGSPAKMAEPIKMPFGGGRLVWAQVTVYLIGAHWRLLVDRIERCVCLVMWPYVKLLWRLVLLRLTIIEVFIVNFCLSRMSLISWLWWKCSYHPVWMLCMLLFCHSCVAQSNVITECFFLFTAYLSCI